jgi:ABC-type branched-subunit amino acid transport system ATPase component/ABC-type branched-subunit amino acid transport system permease subunit
VLRSAAMSQVFLFFVLGLGSGALYALLSLGIVLVYRGSGIVNFAAGAFALFGAAIFYECQTPFGDGGAVAAAIVGTAILGVLVQMLIMGPMRNSSPLARVVATLAVMIVIQQGAVLKYTTTTQFVTGILPTQTVKIFGIYVGENYLYIMGITAVLLIVLSVVYSRTRFGLWTTAVAENELIPASQGISPSLIAAGNWALGGALAGLAGALLVPIVGLDSSTLPLTIVACLAAALIGGFNSFWLTVAGALLIGVLQSETDRYITTIGWDQAVPFFVIVALLIIRGRALPLRSHLTERLPRLGAGRLSPAKTLVALVLIGISLLLFTPTWSAAVTTSAIYATLCLSLVVVTGLCGQLSLAQLALAGIGALVSSRLADLYHIPFVLAFVIAIAVSIPVGLLVALPAVRVRGINLAVLTMGLATVVSSVILNNPSYTGGLLNGTVISPPTVFGLQVNSVTYPVRYAWVCLVVCGASAIIVCNLRRGRSGRRMIAVRDNERAAASLGVSVTGAKLYAFTVAAALAAAAGVLLAFRYTQVTFTNYDVFSGVSQLLTVVLGGIGYVLGALFGGSFAAAGVTQQVIGHVVPIGNWYLFIAASVVLLNLIFLPDGVASAVGHQWRFIVRSSRSLAAGALPSSQVDRLRRAKTPTPAAAQEPAAAPEPAPARRATRPQPVTSQAARQPPQRPAEGCALELRDITVRFGGVTALEDVTLSVAPGEVVGLIGPNGAGKTTLVDVATGYVKAAGGTVTLGQHVITSLPAVRRARLGLTRSFQSLELFEDLSVADNLRVASDPRDRLAYLTDLVRPGRSPLPDVTRAVIDEFDLGAFLERLPGTLGYAQRHLVAIARAVATAPSVLLLDEPAAGLDHVSTRELGDLVRRLAGEWGMGVLVIEHNVPLVLDICDRISVLDFGRVIAEGDPATIRGNSAVIAAYLGGDVLPPADAAALQEQPVAATVTDERGDHA